MTPEEIITKAIHSIPGIRMPMAKIIIDKIFKGLKDNGYEIISSDEYKNDKF